MELGATDQAAAALRDKSEMLIALGRDDEARAAADRADRLAPPGETC
jgi:hypothetical protein